MRPAVFIGTLYCDTINEILNSGKFSHPLNTASKFFLFTQSFNTPLETSKSSHRHKKQLLLNKYLQIFLLLGSAVYAFSKRKKKYHLDA